MFQSTGPITFPCGENEAVLPGVQVFENPVDYQNFTGKPCPTYDPAMPVQNWRDTNTTRTQPGNVNPYAGYTYNIIIRETVVGPSGIPVAGDPVLVPCFVPGFLASRVNIPPLGSGPGVPAETNADAMFPLDPSITQANIVVSPFGISLQAAPTS